MAKIMLVEDDNNLREIYGARLLAEGYEIVSAKDGEEALAMAVKEKPDLIISDIMMPKISGFDMLDILRSTPETKNTKVIMMTALNQAEDKTRADKLGADRYLVKSQVTLEDVAKAAREVLEADASTATSTPTPVTTQAPTTTPATPAVAPSTTPVPEPTPTVTPPAPAATPAAVPAPIPTPIITNDPSTPPPSPIEGANGVQTVDVQENTTPNDQALAAAVAAVTPPAPAATPVTTQAPTTTPGELPAGQQTVMPATATIQQKTSVHSKVIKPINDLSAQQDKLKELIAAEEAKAPAATPAPAPTTTPAPATPIADIKPPAPAATPAPAPTPSTTPAPEPKDETIAPEPVTIKPTTEPTTPIV